MMKDKEPNYSITMEYSSETKKLSCLYYEKGSTKPISLGNMNAEQKENIYFIFLSMCHKMKRSIIDNDINKMIKNLEKSFNEAEI